MSNVLHKLTREEREMLLPLLEEKLRRVEANKLIQYQPYPKQAEFHALGATHRERLLIAGNQQGKTFACACEAGMHATGMYPDWWTGKRFARPTSGWVSCVSMELSRDTSQKLLLGRQGERGSGAIPGYLIESIASHRGVPGAAAVAKIRHVSGGMSTITFKSYDQGRMKFQGDSTDWQWLDEESPYDIYTEALTRINATQGILFMSFTPLLGVTRLIKHFKEENPDVATVRMTIYDAHHYTDEQRDTIIRSYQEHEREARINGLPMMGEGQVFPVSRSAISCAPFEIPDHWPRIAAIDFGWDHPTACVWLAWDRDADVLYAYDCYAQSKVVPIIHAAAIKPKGDWIPMMWPHDGLQHDKGSGEQLAQQYRDQGVKMHRERVTFPDGTSGVEAGVLEILQRFQTGRLKIFSHLEGLFGELVTYHRKDGLIVKEDDDRISAMRYAIMGKRFAITKPHEMDEADFPIYTDY